MAKQSSRPPGADNPPSAPKRRTASSGRTGGVTTKNDGDEQAQEIATADDRAESIPDEPSEEEIRQRAYQRYLDRGGAHGMDFDDWLEAERELRGTRAQKAPL